MGDESSSKKNSVECIIQRINRRRVLPSCVYQRCEPKNRDSLRAQRSVQSVLSSERARAVSPSLLLCIINLPGHSPSVCPSVLPSRHSPFLPVSSTYRVSPFSFFLLFFCYSIIQLFFKGRKRGSCLARSGNEPPAAMLVSVLASLRARGYSSKSGS